ncbi:MAG TPA: aldehyde dehydrogenase family protein [Candidatus Stackebrandtia excrementipullorum]|nr:aldehyde dehydrogenase family protein [Candidatus Stackebrandtia excrementipullorum]
MTSAQRVTYATLTSDNEDLHRSYEAGAVVAGGLLGREITGHRAPRSTKSTLHEVTGPHDPSVVISRVRESTAADVADGIATAKAASLRWATTDWRERVAILDRVADLISDRVYELAALMSLENGKNRLEALGDVEEAADMIRYYCTQMVDNNGYNHPMGTIVDTERTRSVLKPYGVWAVIAPFNFPAALSAGPTGAALVTGNTVVLKPSLTGAFTAAKLFECFTEAGLPPDVAVLLPGGDEVGKAVVDDERIGGITFTGSSQTGFDIFNGFSRHYPKPVMAETGGKNPTIVSANADLDAAALGVARSAFGYAGQKCSACSRVYVDASVHDDFVARLVETTRGLTIGSPIERDTFVGPVVDREAVERYRRAVEHAKKCGTVAVGGRFLGGTAELPGHYLAPTVVTGVDVSDDLFVTELFAPFVAVAAVSSFDEGLRLANAGHAGLTAGCFSSDQDEIDRFLNEIEAGVVYVNRPSGATTGAWPGVQPFGGWKASGSTGKAGGGLYYLPEFLREQSQTVVTA